MECSEAQNDWLPRLDEELSRLPRTYRAVIVACDLEGKTRQQAARQLSLPEGTVASRLARARALLAKRLLRGAQVISATVVTGSAAKAALPAELVHSTIQAAALVAAGNRTAEGVLSAAALTLAKGVMQAMFWNKVKIAGVLLVAAVVDRRRRRWGSANAGGPGEANATGRGQNWQGEGWNKTRISKKAERAVLEKI